MAEPASTSEVVSTAADATRVASIIAHVKENNIAYLIGILISYQMGILENAYTYGSGICV